MRFPFALFAIIIVVQLGVLTVQILGGSRSPENSPAINSSLCVSGIESNCPDNRRGDRAPKKSASRSDQRVYSLDSIHGDGDFPLGSDDELLVWQAIGSAESQSFDRGLLRIDLSAPRFSPASSQSMRIRPVPEPSTALTIGGGCVALALFAQRRRANV